MDRVEDVGGGGEVGSGGGGREEEEKERSGEDVATTSASTPPSSELIPGPNTLPSPLCSGDAKAEGRIKLPIPAMSTLRHKCTTQFQSIANLPWRLAAKTECSKRTNNVKFFSVYIDCNPDSESTLWSCEAVVEFRLLSQAPLRQDSGAHSPDSPSPPFFSRQFTNKFNYTSNNWGFPSFMEWSEVINENKGYIRSDRVIVEAIISVQKTRGVRLSPSFDFYKPHPHCSDGVLVIDGVRLNVSKAYLSLYSPVFAALFFGEFRERSLSFVPIEDVILDEFVEMLGVIYPSHKPVTADNVEYLLELGDKFEVQYVMEECERYLRSAEDLPLITKLVWADQYNLSRLQDVCIRALKSATEIKALRNTEEFKSLSDTTRAALLEKIFKLIP